MMVSVGPVCRLNVLYIPLVFMTLDSCLHFSSTVSSSGISNKNTTKNLVGMGITDFATHEGNNSENSMPNVTASIFSKLPTNTGAQPALYNRYNSNLIGDAIYGNITDTQANTTDISSKQNTTKKASKPPPERSWVYWVPGPLICGFGIVCNIINLAVLSQKELNDSPYTYLTALAISDLTLLSVSFIHLVCSGQPFTYLKSFYDVYIFFSFGNIFFNASVWLVVILTVERVMFVTRPLTFHSSRKKAIFCCVCVFLLCAIANIPRFFCFSVKLYKDQYYPHGMKFRESIIYYRISWAHALLITFIPITILLVTNCVLIRALHKAARERASMRSNQQDASRKDQARLTRTLVVIVVVFIVCTTPSAFVEDPIAYSLFGGDKEWIEYINSPSNQLFIYISNLLIFVNASLNFVLYCAFNRKYRKATKTLIKKLCPQKNIFVKVRSKASCVRSTYSFPQTEETNLR